MAQIIFDASPVLFQSPYLYLQAAGSNGSDGTPSGIYLRWEFTNELGEMHLPKGNLASQGSYVTTEAYNRDDDFVSLHRTQYINYPGTRLKIDLQAQAPTSITEFAGYFEWFYDNLLLLPTDPTTGQKLVIRFWDKASYTTTAGSVDPSLGGVEAYNFVQQYGAFIEIDLLTKRSFMTIATLELTGPAPSFQLELVSRSTAQTAEDNIAHRGEYSPVAGNVASQNIQVFGENIGYARCSFADCAPRYFSFELYDAYFNAVNMASNWEKIDDFSLSLDDTTVHTRLEDPGRYSIANWPHYNDGALVSYNNYTDRWGSTGGVKDAVISYLENSVSASNLTAEVNLPENGNPSNSITISSLVALRMAAMDFHFARMLGVGYIDTPSQGGEPEFPVNYCIQFEYPYERVVIGHQDQYNFSGNIFSLEFWIMPELNVDYDPASRETTLDELIQKMQMPLPDQLVGWRVSVTKGMNGTTQELFMEVKAIDDAQNELSFSCLLAGDAEWYHIVLTSTGGNYSDWNLWINDELNPGRTSISSMTIGNFDNTNNILIGGGYGTYRGCFDELRIYPKELTGDDVAAHYAATRCSEINPDDLLGNWKFNESEGVIAVDSTAYANDGIVTEFAAYRTAPGGGAWLPAFCEEVHCTGVLNFKNEYEKLVFPNSPPLQFEEQDFSVSFWFEPGIDSDVDPENPDASFRTVLSKGNHDYKPGSPYEGGFYLRYYKTVVDQYTFALHFEFRAKDSTTGDEFGFTTTYGNITGEWNFITLRRSGPNLSDWALSVDGIFANVHDSEFGASNQVNILQTVYGLHLGSQYGEINGNADHFTAYDRSLSDEEVLQMFQTGRCNFVPVEDNLVGWWKFDETEGTDAADSTSYGSTANLLQYDLSRTTLGGGAWLPSSCPCIFDDADTARYIYATVYETYKDIPNFENDNAKNHVFMSLPTSRHDQRLPLKPVAEPVQYGMFITGADGSSELITDTNGYSFYDDARYIGLNIQPFSKEEPFQEFRLSTLIQRLTGFWSSSEKYTLSEFSFPDRLGVEYRQGGATAWRKPELLNDPDYFNDTDGGNPVPESLLIPRGSEPLYTHKETSAGVHEYGLYGANWFNRVTAVSNVVTTDNTQFPKRNRLLPPINLACQYIQQEDPVILTSVNEQTMLNDRINASDPDPYFTRMTFLWNQQHNIAYQFADKIEFFFKTNLPKALQGKILSITPMAGNLFTVVTTSFTAYSTPAPTIISPQIPSGEEAKYIGSLFSTDSGAFEIVSIASPGINAPFPTFTVKGIVERMTDSPGNDNQFASHTVLVSPQAAEQFLVVENLQNPSNWDVKLTKTVAIPSSVGSIPLQNYQETVTDDSGSPTTLHIGGVAAPATFNPVPGYPGVYEVTFSLNLPPHPDTDITWYQGSMRFSNNFTTYDPNNIREVTVWRIKTLSPLVIVVYDADYASNAAVSPGTVLPVNFHPGYRVYLYPQATVFNKTNILPAPGEGMRLTLMASRSIDSATSNVSSITPPVQLQAMEIVVPEAPQPPGGADYATRPDVYGKATYTFDCVINTTNRTPFGFVFYRANEQAVLSALYTTATIQSIYADLAALPEPDYINDYWRGLVNLDLDGSGLFKVYGTGTNTYHFPNPDKPIPNTTPAYFTGVPLTGDPNTDGTLAHAAKVAIQSAFVSLTEQPVLYPYVKTGRQTENKPPRILDNSGQMLPPDMSPGAQFDPYPMARVFVDSGVSNIRFTDYTLDGAMYGHMYFYYAIEISSGWKKSDVAHISGPVQLLHTLPAAAPAVTLVTVQTPDLSSGTAPTITFTINPYADSENIRSIAIYRTTNKDLSQSVGSMDLAQVVLVTDTITDEFAGLPLPLVGQDLYYRIVALREITNELGLPENIPSLPSEVIVTKVADTDNPEAPTITATPGNITPTALEDVLLSWPSVAYNATYLLYKLTLGGNWELLYQVTSNDATITYPADGVTFTGLVTESLPKVDSDGDTVYHSFKVDVQNASGLLTLKDNILTI